ncbi:substrate-binding periplasmic protein [Undibacterium sp. JH2W]|uniref:substrate-binding periplasmic protein n=1 Tax=Undibacterium sp. JH2W TaxID=3413037 RepID=UPI003BF1E045
MLNRCLPACLLPICLACNIATAAPKCPPNPIKLDFIELGIYFKSERGVAAGNGIDRDLVDELSKRSGCVFDARMQARARSLIEIKAGRTDMMMATLSTPEREEYLWLFPYVRSHHIVLLGPAAPATMQTLAQFQAASTLKFGAIRGFMHSAFYDPLITAWTQADRIRFYVDEAHLINALIKGEVAAVTSYQGAFQFYIDSKINPNTVRVVDWDAGNLQAVGNLAISKARFSQAEAHEWGMLLKAIQQDGTLLKIYRKYVDAREAQNMLP